MTTTVANQARAVSGSKVRLKLEPVRGSDALASCAIAVLFVAMLVVTWQRWTHPVIDHGREINVPARIASGEQLYTDIFYYYGPFAPYFRNVSNWRERKSRPFLPVETSTLTFLRACFRTKTKGKAFSF